MTMHAPRPRGLHDHREHQTLCGVLYTDLDDEEDSVHETPRFVTCWRCVTLLCGRPLPAEPAVPEHDRLRAVKKVEDGTQLVYDFLTWLVNEKGYVIAARENDIDELVHASAGPEALLADFFGISSMALESEMCALLDYQRAINTAVHWAKTKGKAILKDR